MVIVLFHVIYLLGKLVYRRYSSYKDLNRGGDKEESVTYIVDSDMESDYKDSWSNAMSEVPRLKRRYSNSDDGHEESKSSIKFHPPQYIQRYQAVLDVLTKYRGKLTKIVEFGCAELAFCIYLKNLEGCEEVLFVDIDRAVLETYKVRAKPLHVDYLHRRTRPFVVKILEGSVTQPDRCLENSDAVICIELIEHLYPEPFTMLPINIFGFIKPTVVIITTPNVEFNVLFTNLKGFRHPDHKFEWTRNQFEDWAHNITLRYPDYEVTFHGIGNGPPGTEHLGSCSQMAVFHKKLILDQEKVRSVPGLYETVEVYEYPYEIDNRSDEQKILDDAVYYIRKLSFDPEGDVEEIPIQKLVNLIRTVSITVQELKDILINSNWQVVEREEGPCLVVPPPSETFSSGFNEDAYIDDYIPPDEEYWGPDPGPPNNYYTYQAGQILPEENWDVDTELVTTGYFINPPVHISNFEVWDNQAVFSPVETLRDNITENFAPGAETANSTVSLMSDECFDDIKFEEKSMDLSQPIDSLTLSSFSGQSLLTRESDNSDNTLSSFSQPETSFKNSTSNNEFNLDNLVEPHSVDKLNYSDIAVDDSVYKSVCKNDSMCSMYLEPSKLSRDEFSEDLDFITPDSTFTSPENHVLKKLKLKNNGCVSSTRENSFEEPKFASSPHASLSISSERNKTINFGASSSIVSPVSNDEKLCTNENKLDGLCTTFETTVIEESNFG